MKLSYFLLRLLAGIFACVDQLANLKSDVAVHIVGLYTILFFMLSGRFLLAGYQNNTKEFYIRRVIKIVLPFCVFSLLSLILQIGFSISFGFLKDYVTRLLTGTIEPAFSGMNVLFTFYLVLPFLAKMVQTLTSKERLSLLWVIGGYFTFFDICVLAGVKLNMASFPFLNMIGYALVGYLLDHCAMSAKQEKRLMILGVVAFGIAICEILFMPGVNFSIDTYCLTRYLTAIGVYLFVTRIPLPSMEKGNKYYRIVKLSSDLIFYIVMLAILMGRMLRGGGSL